MSNFAYLLLAFSMCPFASLVRRASGRMAADAGHRCSDLLRRVGLSCGFLCLRSARATSAHMDETDSVSAVPTRPRHWSFTQQRARCAGSALQSPIRFYTHSQVWNRTQIAALANLQISAAETDLPLAELAFAIYFTYFVCFAIAHGQFLSVPFLLMFQCGFLYVCLSSFASRWSKINFGSSRAGDAIPA